MSKLTYASVRVYRQDDGRYKAVASVERAGEDGKPKARTEFGDAKDTPAEALANALELTGFMEE